MKRLKRFCFGLAVLASAFSMAQTKHTYDFEGDSANWSTIDSSHWQHSTQHAANGAYSLSYTVAKHAQLPTTSIFSIDTKQHTIMKVRTANRNDEQIIVGSDYDGMVLGIDYSGTLLWKRATGAGTMNHDLWCADITGDGTDEILAANANGSVYCFDINGKPLWSYKPFESAHLTPMYAVCVVKDANKTPYVVCGDFTCNIYYLSAAGALVKKIHSSKYSKVKAWGSGKPKDYYSVSNFLRPIPQADGSDLLFVNTSNNHMQADGEFHIMKPLSETSQCYIANPKSGRPIGEIRVLDKNKDGKYEVVYGSSTLNAHQINVLTFNDSYTAGTVINHEIDYRKTGVTSYRVNQPFLIPQSGANEYSFLSSNQMLTYAVDTDFTFTEQLSGIYSYNDIWPGKDNRILLASSQDGGSCIHVINTNDSNWKKAFENLEPIGKITRMKASAKSVRKELESFTKPDWQRAPRKVTGFEGLDLPIANDIEGSESLELFASPWNHGKNQEPSWRSPLYDGNSYQNKRDGRNEYILSEQEVFDHFTPSYAGATGISTWGGHGNDPLYFSLKVLKDIASYGWNNGNKRTIYVYPEMNHHGAEFDFVMDNQIFPLIDHLSTMEGHVAFRAKDVFWQGHVYTDTWKDVVSGKHASATIPMLEETTDKTQDMSLLGRMGLWAAGSVDAWGVRCSRDDPSFDRARQYSSQKLSNHFLRKTIFSVACGATYLHNSYPDTENPKLEYHTSLALELIAKEALYVPKRNEIVSFSPVHLSIVNPQERYLNEGSNNKWISYYDKANEDNHPMVFSHMNGSWLGGALTPWDFSTYASGVVDRRQNIVAPYPHGQVLITPVQNGALADNDAPRGKLVDHLHPMYKNIMKEYITDGVDYISADGTQRFKADEYYTQIKKDLEEGENKLPLTVSGDQVGWVAAQIAPKRLRLTLVDGSWLGPKDRQVTVTFHTVSPVKAQDVLSNEVFEIKNSGMIIDVPCGMFRFIDIELSEEL